MTTHIMLDLETWGTEPGCDIRSIGACVFDPVRGYTPSCNSDGRDAPNQTFYIPTDNPRGYWGTGASRDRFFRRPLYTRRKYRLSRDPDTVEWWSKQSVEAQTAFENPVDLKDGLCRFAEWLMRCSSEIHIYGMPIWTPPTDILIWSHGAAADVPWLAAAYKACNLPVPWHYRAPRDTRTIFDAAGIDDHSAWLNQHPGPLGVPHHALDDAICQARAVCGAYSRIEGWRASDSKLGRMLTIEPEPLDAHR